MSRLWSLVGVSAVAVALVPLTSWTTTHAEGSTVATLRPAADAWYPSTAVCAQLPVGCGSAPTTTSYPEKTLHVGATGGQEAARAYLTFSTSGLRTLGSGQLDLTVDPDAGTNAADIASVTACLVATPLGATPPEEAPVADCAVSSIGSYLPGPPSTVSIDLAPFLATPRSTLTLALLPTPVTATSTLTTTWHLAFSSVTRTGSTLPPATALLDVAEGPAPPVDEPVVDVPPVEVPAAPVDLPGVTSPGVTDLPAVVVPGPSLAPVVPTQAQTRSVAAVTVRGGRYGTVWALPLMLFLAGWGVRATGARDLRSYARL